MEPYHRKPEYFRFVADNVWRINQIFSAKLKNKVVCFPQAPGELDMDTLKLLSHSSDEE